MNRNDTVYEHSGALGPAVAILPLGGFFGLIVLSFIYAYILVYSPIAGYISILFVVGFGFALGFMASMLGYWGKCRNLFFLRLCGFTIGALAVYVSWVIFIYALLNKDSDGPSEYNLVAMLLSPGSIWSVIKNLNISGWYSIKSFTPSGVVLWIFWGIEAAIVIGMSTLLSTGSVTSEMFCETCGKWCDSSESFESGLPKEELDADSIQDNALKTLTACDRVSDQVYPRIHVGLFKCKTCDNIAGCKLEFVSVEYDKDGKASEKRADLTSIIPLPYKDFEALKALGSRPIKDPEIRNQPEEPKPTEKSETKDAS